jgi:hypothetical protein
MALSFAQYETLFNDATLAPKLKVFASRLLRDWYKANPSGEVEFVSALAQMQVPEFLERCRVEMLGELDDAGVATPNAADLGAAARAALRNCCKIPTL